MAVSCSAAAAAANVSYLFEGAVAGGIPIIRALMNGLNANEIESVYGILNGTTNYILTGMARDGKAYADVLKQAQELGYAEADPTADVSGARCPQQTGDSGASGVRG